MCLLELNKERFGQLRDYKLERAGILIFLINPAVDQNIRNLV